jgi:hypothetical protein
MEGHLKNGSSIRKQRQSDQEELHLTLFRFNQVEMQRRWLLLPLTQDGGNSSDMMEPL